MDEVMRVSKEKAAQNRERIVSAAARLFRERGLSGVGVDALTEAAGLTHGSLYSHFGSKERLAAEALSRALGLSADRMGSAKSLGDYVERYLSLAHRDRPGEGCVMAALAAEIPRQGEPVRRAFTDAVRTAAEQIDTLARGKRKTEDDALAILATMVGALTLARAVDDPELSERLLDAARTQIADGKR